MRKKTLLCYSHGLGDIIQLIPVLNYFYQQGHICDLMVRKEVISSKLLNTCPYINKLFPIINPWQSPIGKTKQEKKNCEQWKKLMKQDKYDFGMPILHHNCITPKIDMNFVECGIDPKGKDKSLEVFISSENNKIGMEYIKKNYPNGYILTNSVVAAHPWHSFKHIDWIKKNLLDLPIIDIGDNCKHHIMWKDINITFVLIKEAKHLILNSSVWVHASDALEKTIDLINYGKPDHKVWPLNQSKVLHIKEAGKFIK